MSVHSSPLTRAPGPLVDIDGVDHYRIDDVDTLPPFLTSVVSDSDHWLFVSSAGALTAGRRVVDEALFPYCAEDRLHDSAGHTGGLTLVQAGGALWEPFRTPPAPGVRRALLKSVLGNAVVFHETNPALGLVIATSWRTSARFGFVRTTTLTNLGTAPVDLDVLDGLHNILPAGVDRGFYERLSTLLDGYRDSELLDGGLGLHRLSTVPADVPEPREALRATTIWSCGTEVEHHLLSTTQVADFRSGVAPHDERRVRGLRGAYLVHTRPRLAPGESVSWMVVADVAQHAGDVVATQRLLRDPAADPRAEVEADIARGTAALRATVASADGLQLTGDALDVHRHYSNVLYNVMRGGVPVAMPEFLAEDFATYVRRADRTVAERHAELLAKLPAASTRGDLVAHVAASGDPDLERLGREYLPLVFSRRHGDPSRPWNDFRIALHDEVGRPTTAYEGNWRDIFQNWEALARSFPDLTEAMVFKFVDCSTADGHNPARITQTGFDWDVEHGGPGSHIGYWGDHQVVYLHALLEAWAGAYPRGVHQHLDRSIFTYADVPYRLKPYAELRQDPRHGVLFDHALDAVVRRRVAEAGAAHALLPGPDGGPMRVTLAEKLLLAALARFGAYVPGAGIWMNTQRPEWNDGNNALAGYGTSVVTAFHLRRYITHLQRLFGDRASGSVTLTAELAALLTGTADALNRYRHPHTGSGREELLAALATAADGYRQIIYADGFSGARTEVRVAEVLRFCAAALRHLDATLADNRREDGLWHSYNVMVPDAGGIEVRRLHLMLEGQAAALASGLLDANAAERLLSALRESPLYRADQRSYLLAPDRVMPGFLDRGVVPDAPVRSGLLAELIRRGDQRIILRDVEGRVRFGPEATNARRLSAVLAELAAEPELTELVRRDRDVVLALHEEVFDHRSFIGRAERFYKYEGLGSIYWHMVSKLLLAAREVLAATTCPGEPLRDLCEDVRAGLGVHKTPREHGAVPIEPYSHTPSFAGAQQPGMTGQVKEDIVTRLGELGLRVEHGTLRLRPDLIRPVEFRSAPGIFHHVDVNGRAGEIAVPAGAFAFTHCQTPIVVHRGGEPRIVVTLASGGTREIAGLVLDERDSAEVFGRTGRITRLEAYCGLSAGPSRAA